MFLALTSRLVKVFDLLYLNGQSLLHRSTTFRKKNMRSCIKEISGRIEFAVEFKGKTAKDIRERMDEIMASRGEGLVIKHPLSEYVLNGRNNDWIKVKPEYMVCLAVTIVADEDTDFEPLNRTIWARQWMFLSSVCQLILVATYAFLMLVLQLEIMAAANALEGYRLSFVPSLTTNVHMMTMKNPSTFGLSCIFIPWHAADILTLFFSADTVPLSA